MAGLQEAGEAASHPVQGYGQLATTVGRAYVSSALRSPVNYAVTGVAMALRRPTELLAGNLPPDAVFGETPPAAPGTLEFEAWLTGKGIPEPVDGQLELKVGGEEFFSSVEQEMARAQSSIDVQVFIFDNDDFAVGFAEELKRRSTDLKVRVLFDDLGTALSSTVPPETPAPEGFKSPSNIAKLLKKEPYPVPMRRTLNPWLVADHSKLFVFDQRVAYVGGMNIGREYRTEWHDMMVRMTGPVTGVVSRDFDRRWQSCRFPGRIPGADRLDPMPPTSKNPLHGIRVLRTDVVDARFEILSTAIAAIRSAQKRVWMETPYFSSDTIERELIAAAKRGVDVQVIFPGTSDSQLMKMANAAAAADIIEAGGHVMTYRGMTHLKALVCDDWAMVGSANYDTLSMAINRELNLATAQPDFVEALARRVFRVDFRNSDPLDPTQVDEVLSRIAETVADQL
ncbi:cardiolipin synthase [Haloferula luteola]|uniref:Cardiolipin synthase n=1 Tax=Haloferula luteola TaxID=595692 RepID=A0A840V532_9BACT|nr:phosphatidylserine/phosphatidylglycerophosphate/cardiolipin synthase family protein [Haloferula luteola]MBB5349898.1 cardiolipin synthase [Haloferula luteola]